MHDHRDRYIGMHVQTIPSSSDHRVADCSRWAQLQYVRANKVRWFWWQQFAKRSQTSSLISNKYHLVFLRTTLFFYITMIFLRRGFFQPNYRDKRQIRFRDDGHIPCHILAKLNRPNDARNHVVVLHCSSIVEEVYSVVTGFKIIDLKRRSRLRTKPSRRFRRLCSIECFPKSRVI